MNHIIWSPGVKLEDIEKQVILQAYSHFRNNKTATAAALGISARTLDTRLHDYDAQAKQAKDAGDLQQCEREAQLARSRGTPPSIFGSTAAPNALAAGGNGMESLANAAAQPTVSVPERAEVQDVLPDPAAGRSVKRRS